MSRLDPVRGLGFDLGLDPEPDSTRSRIARAYRADEAATVGAQALAARLTPAQLSATQALATKLAVRVRAARAEARGADALIQVFSLDSHQGIALMCLAEALLRIPDAATRDRLIRDKIGHGDWRAHLGGSPSPFVNAGAWGLLVTGKLVAMRSENALEQALTSLLRKGGEPLIRKGVDLALRLMGKHFVAGRTIDEALAGARAREARGYRFSFDMLGEAALTQHDAAVYFAAYESAIHAIGRAAAGRGVQAGPGISVKLSALHPRYSRAERDRVRRELTPKLAALATLACHYDIGLNIDAEEADRLDLSLDLLARIAGDPGFAHWQGLGFAVQAYQKRALPVIDWIIELARKCRRRMMLRLVKGAYWDTEIKRAQIDGLSGYPVFTRKVHTDVSYLACAKALLAAPREIFPQFATHNALSIAAVHTLAGDAEYEFQCLHGMGEIVYDQLVESDLLARPCRIYAPVGAHAKLLSYLVRRLLENGANTSFVNRVVDADVSIAELVALPVFEAAKSGGAPHAQIPLPAALLPGRINSHGVDLSDDAALHPLAESLALTPDAYAAAPVIVGDSLRTVDAAGEKSEICNPADRNDVVGTVVEATQSDVTRAVCAAVAVGKAWSAMAGAELALCLERAADLLEAERATFYALAVREAGKTLPNAVAEVREAVDFCRYYAEEARADSAASDAEAGSAIGPVVAISPWNFPLAIFVGQVSAALAAGNPVLAKPAEATPLIAATAVHLFHRAGVPRAALQLLPGRGELVGAALVADPRIAGVIFTGSVDVARAINRQLAQRDDDPVLIAETGGQNAMIVDSSALPEQVVADVLVSAFDSAGQRCSALRLLCLQEDVADSMVSMLEAAMRELTLGDPRVLATDVGPVIDADARDALTAHTERLRVAGQRVVRLPLPAGCERGTFVAPTLIDLGRIEGIRWLTHEVFGPVLHVVRWKRDELLALVDAINATGYALTLGIHSRIDETVAAILDRVHAGNVYVNRTMIGAVVGVQPFGGYGLSGTGPKAGGPFYRARLMRGARVSAPEVAPDLTGALHRIELPGPTGESNVLELHPRGMVACLADDTRALVAQARAALAMGNTALLLKNHLTLHARDHLPAERIVLADKLDPAAVDLVLLDVAPLKAREVRIQVAGAPGKIVPVIAPDADGNYDWRRVVVERTVTINTAAAGGNTLLLSLPDVDAVVNRDYA